MDKLTLIEERDLLKKMQVGDAHAFRKIYGIYQPALFLYAYKLTEDEDEAADLVQELFISIWEHRQRLDVKSSLKAYLYKSIRHRFLNAAARHRVRDTFISSFQKHLEQGHQFASDHIAEKELYEYLDKLVAAMPEKMGMVFKLRNENMSDEEISAKLGISEKTVKNLMSRAIKALKTQLKKFYLILFL